MMLWAWLVVSIPLALVMYLACRKRRRIRDAAAQLGE
jgi:hypothetical protein